jgi:hypothetical protein
MIRRWSDIKFGEKEDATSFLNNFLETSLA